MKQKKVIVLGASGSIGKSALDIIQTHAELFTLVGASTHTNEAFLASLKKTFPQNEIKLALSGKDKIDAGIHYSLEQGLLELIRDTEADIVVNGISGASGLLPSVAAIESKKDLALANKETMVMAGTLVNALAEKNKVSILPVDSEHSAVFRLLHAHGKEAVEEIILTASGGAFRDKTIEELQYVTLKDALKHPNWSMGPKITIDSASMANKGLEVIEAVKLFGFKPNQIGVRIHKESKVHSLVRTKDGSLYAELSNPDMRLPIQNALTWPTLLPFEPGRMSLDDICLNFKKPDLVKYKLLALAYECAEKDASYPIAYNAANEIAVEAFMKEKINFLQIATCVEKVLQHDFSCNPSCIQEVLQEDKRAREIAFSEL